MAHTAPSELPLAGIKVLDFSWLLVGPITTKYLAMFGAEVIKVESRRRVDAARMSGPFIGNKPGIDKSGMFANHNLSKRSVALNLNTPRGIELARRLVLWADIVIENFSPGVIDRLGLGYADLAAIKPSIIMLSASMQGATGPRASHPGIGNNLQALAGLDHLTGHPDDPPSGPTQVLPNFIGPWFALIALLCALEHRDRTGQGQYIDFSQYEAILHLVAPACMDYTVNGHLWTRQGNRAADAAPHGVYRCRPDEGYPHADERWIAIACFDDQQWRALCTVLRAPELADDARFHTLSARKQHESALDEVVEEHTREWEAGALMRALQAAGVPAGAVHNGRDLLTDPQLAARGHFHRLAHPVVGELPFDGPAFRLSASQPRIERAPLFSEHSRSVYRDILRLSEDEIRELEAEGVIGPVRGDRRE